MFWTNRSDRSVSAFLPATGSEKNNCVAVTLLYRTGNGYILQVSPASRRNGLVTIDLGSPAVMGIIEHARRYSTNRFGRLADLMEYEIAHKCGAGWTHVRRVLADTGMTTE